MAILELNCFQSHASSWISQAAPQGGMNIPEHRRSTIFSAFWIANVLLIVVPKSVKSF
jgi:hypothetical protein